MTRRNKRVTVPQMKCVVQWTQKTRYLGMAIGPCECRKNAGHHGRHRCDCGAVRSE